MRCSPEDDNRRMLRARDAMDRDFALPLDVPALARDAAVDFYVNKLGLEVSSDLDLGFMRWLTVCVSGDPSREILLEKPGPPAMDDATAAQVRELVTKGAMGGWLCITTPDAQGTYETLKARGVDITDEPSPKPYGIDFGIRDPFGNAIRIGQMFESSAG